MWDATLLLVKVDRKEIICEPLASLREKKKGTS